MIAFLGFTCAVNVPYYQCSFSAKVSPFLSHAPSSIHRKTEESKGSKMEIKIRIHRHESHRT